MAAIEEALEQTEAVTRRYAAIARWYDWFTDYEARQHERAVNLPNIDSRAKVLDVACGTGRGIAALSARLEPDVLRQGVDATGPMLDRARRRMASLGLDGVTQLRIGDAR